jgi:hypothetical protein
MPSESVVNDTNCDDVFVGVLVESFSLRSFVYYLIELN